jgi:DNA invertase Pin-like site-specific DNA recombinase
MTAPAFNPTLKTQPLIAIGMSRVSLGIQVDNYSLETQNNKILDLGRKWNFVIPEGFMLDDAGKSGTTVDRPAIRLALKMIKRGDANAVVFPYVDRFARTVEGGLNMIRQFREAGAKVLFGEFGWVEDNIQTKILLVNLLAMAETQRDSIVEKSISCVATKVSKGLAHGGHSPFGWHFVTALEIAAEALSRGEKVPTGKPQNIHKPVPEDIRTLRLIGQLILGGCGAKAVCRELYARAVKSPKGKDRWNPSTVRDRVEDQCYSTGIWYFNKSKRVKPETRRKPEAERTSPEKSATKPRPQSEWIGQQLEGGPVWTPEEQREIIAALKRNGEVKVGKPTAEAGWEAILKRLIVCKRTVQHGEHAGEICNKKATSKQRIKPNGHHAWYVCSNRDEITNKHCCSGLQVRAEVFESAVWEGLRKAVVDDLDQLVARYREEITASVDAEELDRLKAQEKRLKAKYDEARARELATDDQNDKQFYAGQMSQFKAEIAFNRKRIMSATENVDPVQVDTATIRKEVGAAMRTKVRSERREILVGMLRMIEWVTDDMVTLVIRIPRRNAGVNGQQHVHAGLAGRAVQEDRAAGDRGVPVRQPAREESRPLGGGTHGRKDGRVPLA